MKSLIFPFLAFLQIGPSFFWICQKMPRNRQKSSLTTCRVRLCEVPRGAQSWQGSYRETRRFGQKNTGKRQKMGESEEKMLVIYGKKEKREGKRESGEKKKNWRKKREKIGGQKWK